MLNRILPLICLLLSLTVASHAIPSAADDFYYTDTNTVLVVSAIGGLLANDSYGDFIVTLDLSSLQGSLTGINLATGAFTYDPGLFQGLDSFKYSIYSLAYEETSSEATVRIQVPDGGITLILLGLGLGGLALLRRKLA